RTDYVFLARAFLHRNEAGRRQLRAVARRAAGEREPGDRAGGDHPGQGAGSHLVRPSEWVAASVRTDTVWIRRRLWPKSVNIPLVLTPKPAGNRGFRSRRPAAGQRRANV